LLVGETPDDDHDKIDQRPNAQPTQRKYLKNSGPNFPDVESVKSKNSEKEAKQESWKDAFVRRKTPWHVALDGAT